MESTLWASAGFQGCCLHITQVHYDAALFLFLVEIVIVSQRVNDLQPRMLKKILGLSDVNICMITIQRLDVLIPVPSS